MQNENQFDINSKDSAADFNFYREIVNSIKNFALFAVDQFGTIISWNQGVETLFGYRQENFTGQNFSIIFGENSFINNSEELESYLRNLSAQNVVHESLRRRDGSLFRARISCQPLTLNDQPKGFALNIQELSNEKFEEIQKQKDEFYHSILKNFPDGAVFIFNRELRFIIAEGRRLSEMELLSEQFVGKSIYEALAPEICEVVEPFYHAALRGEDQTLELKSVGRIYKINFSPVKSSAQNEQSKFELGMVTTQDITELLARSDELEKSRSEIRTILESITDAFFSLDKEWRFTYLNQEAEKLLFRSAEELLGKDIWKMFPEAAGSTFETQYQKAVQTQQTVSFEEFYPPLDAWFEVRAFPSHSGLSVYFHNVNDRKRREQEQRETALKFKLALEGGEMGWWNYEPATDRSAPDEKCLQLFGLNPESYNGDAAQLFEIIHPEDRAPVRQALIEAIKNKTRYQTEFRVVLSDGKIRWIAGLGRAVYRENGEAEQVYGVNFDITDRRQAESVMRESEEKFRTLADNMSQFSWMADSEGSIFWYNQRWFDYTGTTLDEMKGWGWRKVHHPDHVERVVEKISASFESGTAWEDIFPLRSRDGEYRWFLSRALPIKNETGKIVRWFGTNTDITESRASELKLRASEERFRGLQQATPDGFMIFEAVRSDDGGIIDFRWVYVNPAAEKIVGRSEKDLLGKFLLTEMPGNRNEGLFEAYVKVVETDEIWRREFSYNHENLDHYFLSTAVKVGDGFAVAFTDVTERKMAEKDREDLLVKEQTARAEAEAATRAKDEFLATVTHELRSPLNSILGWNLMLRNQPSPELLVKVTEIIDRQGKQQLQLIEDLLDTARIVSGKIIIEQNPVDLAEVVKAALEVVRPAADHKKIQLEQLIGINGNEIVTGDAVRLQQVISNLLSNSIKFTPQEGRIEIKLIRENSNAKLIIKDNGKGIARDFLPFVFDRFSQADSSKSRRFGGLGLGLSLVKQLTELHGGTVNAHSDGEGKGSIFTLTFPIRAVGLIDGKPTLQLSQPLVNSSDPDDRFVHMNINGNGKLSGARILVADDMADARELVRFTLEEEGAQVNTFESGTQALKALGAGKVDAHFDLFVCDIGMPDADGYTIINRLREIEEERGGNLPAIALTAFSSAQDKNRALEAGFQMHISKPVEPDYLVLMVASLLSVKNI